MEMPELDAITFIIQKIFDIDMLTRVSNKVALFTVGIALGLAPIFYAITFVWSFAKETIKNTGTRPKFFDKDKLIRGIVIWFMIGAYIPIFGSVDYITTVIVSASEPDNYLEWKSNHAKAVSPVEGETKEEQESGVETAPGNSSGSAAGESNIGLDILDIGGRLKAALMTWSSLWLAILGFAVSIIVTVLSLLIGKVLYVLGPLALAFSILPAFEDKLGKWFGAWLLCLFNPLTVNLLNAILIEVTFDSFAQVAGDNVTLTTGIGVVVFNLIVIICYVLTFWLTSMFVGSPDAGKVLSTAASMATAGAGMAAKMFGGAAGAGGGVPDLGGAAKPKT